MLMYSVLFVVTTPLMAISIYLIFNTVFEERSHLNNSRLEKLSYLVYALGLVILFAITRRPIAFLLYNLICFYVISLNYHSKLINRLLYVLLIYMSLMAIEVFVSLLTGISDIEVFKNSEYRSVIGIIVIRIIIVVLSYILYKRVKIRKNNIDIPAYYSISSLAVLIGTLYLYIVSLENVQFKFNVGLIGGVVVMIVNAVIIFFDNKLSDLFISETERNNLQLQNIAYQNQSQIINQSLITIKSMKHDMKNHLIALKSLYDNKQTSDFASYINQLVDDLDASKKVIYSNNFIVDSIVNYKLKDLTDQATSLKLDIKVPQKIKILAYDLTVILGNLLDNATRALNNSKGNKALSISIQCDKGSIIILIDNTFDDRVIVKNETLITTKPDKENHGMGLKNVKRIVAQYGGRMEVNYTGNMFSVAVIIPEVI